MMEATNTDYKYITTDIKYISITHIFNAVFINKQMYHSRRPAHVAIVWPLCELSFTHFATLVFLILFGKLFRKLFITHIYSKVPVNHFFIFIHIYNCI